MIRLQAKQEQRTALLSVEKADTQVACVAQALTQTIRYNDKEIICETQREQLATSPQADQSIPDKW